MNYMKIVMALAFCFATFTANAQEYPSRPIKLIVPFPPGGTTDLLARIIVERMSVELGHPVVVENKPGAGGLIGAEAVSRALPDGYTLGMATVSTHAVGPSLYKRPAYNPTKDFSPISKLATVPNVLVGNPSFAAKNIADLIRIAKAKPDGVTYASPGAGTIGHLLGEEFQYVAKIELVHVPYRGAGPALNDLLGGQVQLMFDNLPTSLPNILSGKLKAFAVASPKRVAQLPDVPTFAEVGLDDVNDEAWFGLVGPAGLPKSIVARINKALVNSLATPAVAERLTKIGAVGVGNSPEQFAQDIQKELSKAQRTIKAAKITLE
jgi:tripartite-type tricarboxylate transporter receptor subunit TctC